MAVRPGCIYEPLQPTMWWVDPRWLLTRPTLSLLPQLVSKACKICTVSVVEKSIHTDADVCLIPPKGSTTMGSILRQPLLSISTVHKK